MKRVRRTVLIVASVLATLLMSAPSALASGSPAGSGTSGGSGGSGGTKSSYADLWVVLRAVDGTPVLKAFDVPATETTTATTEYCAQPVSSNPIPGVSSQKNPVDLQTVWLVPLQGQWLTTSTPTAWPKTTIARTTITACAAQPAYAMFVSEVTLERLNMVRTSETVTERMLATVTTKLEIAQTISLESTGRISIDGTPIDSPGQNAAIYKSLMETGTIPGLPTTTATTPTTPTTTAGPPAQISDGYGTFDAMDLAAMTIGATASKTVPLSIDAVEYYNQIIGFPPSTVPTGTAPSGTAPYKSPWGLTFVTAKTTTGQVVTGTRRYVDYTRFTYNRSTFFPGSVTWLTVPTLTWKVTRIITKVPFHDLVPDDTSTPLTGVTAFAQLADDVRSLCNFIPDNTFIPGFYMDLPFQDTYTAQEATIHNPAVSLGTLPAKVIETSPFTVTAQLLNPFAGTTISHALLHITITAPGTLTTSGVTATATTGQSVTFSAQNHTLTGSWGPPPGFLVNPGYNQSTTFSVTVATGAPTGTYTITLDLVTVTTPTTVLATDSGTVTVLPNVTSVFWGDSVPRLITQGTPAPIPLQVYSPTGTTFGTALLDLTVSAPEPLAVGNVHVYGSTGTAMVAMPLTANVEGQLEVTWTATLETGFNPLTWYVSVATDAPPGTYTFGVGTHGGSTVTTFTALVVASESNSKGSGGTNEGGSGSGAKTITSPASKTFYVSRSNTFSVTTTGTPIPTLAEEGTLPAGVTFTDNQDGTATLAGTPTATGVYPLTFTAEFDASDIVTQTFTLTVAAPLTTTTATKLVVTNELPVSVSANRIFTVKVSIENGAGAVLTTKATTVTLAIKSGSGTPGASLTCNGGTAKAAATGVAGFSCSIDKAGTGYVLTASAPGLTSVTTSAFTVTATSGSFARIYGTDAIATSIEISDAEFPAAGSASAAVLASSSDKSFSDALAGGPFAAYEHGPLLLTSGASVQSALDTGTKSEIERVLPPGATVYVLGGNLALSPAIDATLESLGYHVVREAGITRDDTAYEIAVQMGSPNVIFEATGTSFYDALSAVPAAIANHGAILLTDGTTQSAPTATYIAAHPGATRYAVGGPLAAYGADPGAIPVYGTTLFDTSAAVAAKFFPSAYVFGVATSVSFADSVSGGVYMATGGRSGPLLIVNPSPPLSTAYTSYLAGLDTTTTATVVFGGPLAVAATVGNAIRKAMG